MTNSSLLHHESAGQNAHNHILFCNLVTHSCIFPEIVLLFADDLRKQFTHSLGRNVLAHLRSDIWVD